MNINLDLRSEVLEYSLQLEKYINELILLNLGILSDTKETRLFGYKSNISFKNKIDLLCDIDILTKEENAELELLMNFRNKFLHVLECNSFSSIIINFDNGLKNRFKVFLNKNESIESETDCRKALKKLYLKNIETIKTKAEDKLTQQKEKHEIITVLNQRVIKYIELFQNLSSDITSIVLKANLKNPEIKQLCGQISKTCEHYNKRINTDEEIRSLSAKHSEFFSSNEKVMNLYGIRSIDTDFNKTTIETVKK